MIAYPPLDGKGSPMLTQNRQFQWYIVGSYIYPMIPAYAATLLHREGYEVIWEDCIASQKKADFFWNDLLKIKPEIVAIETKTPVVRQHWAIANRIKTELPQSYVVIMGDHVTALPIETMENCLADFVITGGDYDFTLLNIANHLDRSEPLEPGIYYRKDGKICNTGPFELKHDLDSLPFIDRGLTQSYRYGEKWKRRTPFFYTMTGRDCPWAKCSFCSWTTIFPKFRRMSVERALDEIGYLIENHNSQEIFDDSGTFPGGTWLANFCEGMISRGYHKKILFSCNMRFEYLQDPELPKLMKKAGWRKIKAGLESANQKTLDRIQKGTSVEQIVTGCRNAAKAGIDVHLTVMVGFPWETRSDAQRTLDLAKQLMADGFAEMLQSTVVVPYPGTPLFEEAVQNKWLSCKADDYDKFDMRGSVLKMPDMTSEDIVEICNAVYRSFLTPRFVVRQIANNITDPNYLLRGAKAVMGHLLDFTSQKSKFP
jgi:radical SAM superfamily enzyme YgiQ (UPF0313 family)